MSNDKRKEIHIKTVDDISELGQINRADLIKESIQYDKENYYLLDHLDDKEIVSPTNKTEVITIRLTQTESENIKKVAIENGLSKSALVRMVVKRELKI